MAFLVHVLDSYHELGPPIVWKSHWTVNMMPKNVKFKQSLSHISSSVSLSFVHIIGITNSDTFVFPKHFLTTKLMQK